MLTLFVIGASGVGEGGREGVGHIVPAADFFVCCGSIRDIKKALDKVLKAYG